MDQQQTKQAERSSAFSPRDFILKYLRYLPWLLVSCALFLVLAFLKLRYSQVIYQVQSKLLIKKDSRSGGSDKFADIFMSGESQNLNDEIQILKSTGISKRVIKNLDLQTTYISEGNVKSSTLHKLESPFLMEIIELKDSLQGFGTRLNIINETNFMFDNEVKQQNFGEVIENSHGKFKFVRSTVPLSQFPSLLFTVTWMPLQILADGVASGINVAPVNDFSNVLVITYETDNPRIGRDILNELMKEYNISNVEDKRTTTVYTLEFIDERLDTLKRELNGVEKNLQSYRETNKAVNLEQQSLISFNELSSGSQTLANQEVQLKVLGYLTDYLADQRNANKTVPTSLGITEPSLQALIAAYNSIQLKRETLILTTPAANQIVKDVDAELQKLREQIQESFRNIREAYLINRRNLLAKNEEAEKGISSVPGKGRKLLEITREQKILEDLYSFLLQKKLETSISSASTISNSKVLEPAKSLFEPVRPDRKGSYIIAVLLGLGIPIALISLREYLNDKIRSRADVERLTKAPILGEIGHSEQAGVLVVLKNNRKFISEQFRIIRTNLQYVLNKVERPVILVTSSYSGEGKSFISTNMGAVLALSGKRTVILEFDIRKPKIISGLDLVSDSKFNGITNFIVGNLTVPDILLKVEQVENLFVIPCGPIPPNPAELLLDEKVKELFDYLNVHFDAIIIDSAPVGLVSDAIVLSVHANATLYIMRQDYTLKKQLELVNNMYENNKLPKMSLLLNDVKASGGYGSYYGNYGYGYSYGNAGEYFEPEQKKKKGFLKRIKKAFGSK